MYWEINVALDGRHFFATAPRSITSQSDLRRVYRALQDRFAEASGYSLSVTYHSGEARRVTEAEILG